MAIPRGYFEWAAKLFDPTGIHEKPEAVRDLRVLDFSVIYFGPATADFLGEILLEERLRRLFLREPRARDFVDAKRYSGVAYRSSRSFHAQ